jgi:hypothetical protein
MSERKRHPRGGCEGLLDEQARKYGNDARAVNFDPIDNGLHLE